MTNEFFDTLKQHPRLLLEAELKPLQGGRFQATGFPDLGPALYQLPDGTPMLLVESAQSVANRLEAVCWDEAAGDLIPELQGMPYIAVMDGDRLLTSSIVEAHRINSPYILEGTDPTVLDRLKNEAVGEDFGPVDIGRLARTVFKYDTNAVIHGVFLAKSDLAGGRLRLPRLLSGFIEARNVLPVESGGVKNDRVDPGGDTQKGFGNVPFHRTEFTAQETRAFFNIDLALLKGYGLESAAEDLIVALSLFKIMRFLSTGLRLRTACDLETVDGLEMRRPGGIALPPEEELVRTIREKITACASAGLFADPPVTRVAWHAKGKKKKGDQKKEEE